MKTGNVFVVFAVLWHNCLANASANFSALANEPSAGFQEGVVYSFINIATGLALDVYHKNQSNGAAVGTFALNGKSSQKWRAIKSDAGWQLRSLIGNNKCLDEHQINKPKLQQWGCGNSYNQRWYAKEILPISTTFKIICLSSGHAITAYRKRSAPVRMKFERRGDARQLWVLKRT